MSSHPSRVTGCTNPSGGSTLCGDYNKMTADQKSEVIKKVLSDKGNPNPTNAEINLKVSVVSAYCQPDCGARLGPDQQERHLSLNPATVVVVSRQMPC